MLQIYCRDLHHTGGGLCDECCQLLDYAWRRLASCPFQEEKPACNHCRVHCYSKDKRTKVQTVMRYAGPRMIWHHPLLAIGHMIDGMRKEPGPKKNK